MKRAELWLTFLFSSCVGGCAAAPSPGATTLLPRPAPSAEAKPQVETPAANAAAPAALEVDACGCPLHAPPAGVSLWSKQFEAPLVACSTGFSGPNVAKLSCYPRGQEPQTKFHIDPLGKQLPDAPPDAVPNAQLERAFTDPKTWGKPGRGAYGTGQLPFQDGGGVVWAGSEEDSEASQVVRIDPSGKKLWTRAVQGLYVTAIGDEQGGVIVAGMIADRCTFPGQPGAFAQQGIVSRVGANGELLWTQRLACSTTVSAVRLPSRHEVAVMGHFSPRSDDDQDWAGRSYVSMLSIQGEPLYTRSAEGELWRGCSCVFQLLLTEYENAPPKAELRALP